MGYVPLFCLSHPPSPFAVGLDVPTLRSLFDWPLYDAIFLIGRVAHANLSGSTKAFDFTVSSFFSKLELQVHCSLSSSLFLEAMRGTRKLLRSRLILHALL